MPISPQERIDSEFFSAASKNKLVQSSTNSLKRIRCGCGAQCVANFEVFTELAPMPFLPVSVCGCETVYICVYTCVYTNLKPRYDSA